MKRAHVASTIALLFSLIVTGMIVGYWARQVTWSNEERQILASLSLANLPIPPTDISNRYADNPHAAALGQQLFFDTRLSKNGQVACATCHQPERNFTDGLSRSRGIGQTARKSMSVVGAVYSPWLFWDGRKDSLWSQALGPLEDPNEHGLDRTQIARLIARYYEKEYEAVFGSLPNLKNLPRQAGPVADEAARAAWQRMFPSSQQAVNRVFVNVGKAIAAYERQLLPTASRFDKYLTALAQNDTLVMRTTLSNDEVAGLKLFIGKANCMTCHSGPLLTNNDFHNTGVPGPTDSGRQLGARRVAKDEFNCLSRYSDAVPSACSELRFLKVEGLELERAFKVPSLRNTAKAPPYMHAGQFKTLRQVLEHYNRAPEAPAGHSELSPLGLSENEIAKLEAFLKSLNETEGHKG